MKFKGRSNKIILEKYLRKLSSAYIVWNWKCLSTKYCDSLWLEQNHKLNISIVFNKKMLEEIIDSDTSALGNVPYRALC